MSSHQMLWADIDGWDEFPFRVMNTFQGSSDSHSHAFYEVVYVEEGFCLHFSDGHVSLLMAGDLIALVPGQAHYYRCRSNVAIWNILFQREALDGLMPEVRALPAMAAYLDGEADGALHTHLSLRDRQRLRRMIDELREERDSKQAGWMLQGKAILTKLTVLMARVFGPQLPLHQSENPYLGYVLAATARIEEDYGGALSVAGIAAELGIGADHFTRQFRQIMGITPTEYIRRYRFAKALELLRRQMPVSEVCTATGFRRLSYFSREFKAMFNMTPSAFQRQVREKF